MGLPPNPSVAKYRYSNADSHQIDCYQYKDFYYTLLILYRART